ncbi:MULTISPECIES: DUF4399 domain-containing protein [unclassified Duganella]|jgi:hypothetical protein|uniref:DUF4399 domain-containing protein n=1 Tax=unclassified Duganella TaxID=2636909 RepID=UPI0008832A10|nr:protein of unknown function [Duganella sp. OV458]SDI73669.1 protein of unknown function [Duganella sp. OV510]
MMKPLLAATLLTLSGGALAQQSVSFVEPANGATVGSPFKVRFAVAGMSLKPAGDMSANTGHHHLLINATPVKAGEVIPTDEKHIHFGKGQTETELTLPPGSYTLTMQFANGLHQAYGAGMNKEIRITVK